MANTWIGLEATAQGFWEPVLKKSIELGSNYQIVPTEGYLAWEYNPLRNYRLSKNMYEKDGKYYTKREYETITGNKADEDTKDLADGWTLREAGELVDFISDELHFNIQNPVDILPQYSYDGSVNLILNDGLNIPRLINSRFTVTGKNTYKVIDRKGDNDTNIYDQGDQFDTDTSLFKNINTIPTLEYLGTSIGNLKIGNYHFYFKYSDADGNESDWVAESGLVSIFIGSSPQSVNTGIRDENSIKSVMFKLSNIDIGYTYVKVYYTRYTADVDGNLVVSAKRIDKNFLISKSGTCTIIINGDENETDSTIEEINTHFDAIQTAQTQCSASNRLFMANIHKTKIEYDILTKLSLCFCPYKHEEPYPLAGDHISQDYAIMAQSDGYYDSKYIYDKVGYWPGELYRIGIVYILKDGSLSPVFNIRGSMNIPTLADEEGNLRNIYKVEQDFNDGDTLQDVLKKIAYAESDFMMDGGKALYENAKGVIQLSETYTTNPDAPFPVYGIQIQAHPQVLEELKNYTKGFFFVRQKRIPTTLCQGVVVGLDKESRTPTLPTLGGVINKIEYDKSFIETEAINDINFISEGFLGRYFYKLEEKPIEKYKKWLLAIGAVLVIAAAVVASVFTCGAAAVALGVSLAAVTAAMTTAGTVIGITAVATAGLSAAAAISAGVERKQIERNKGAAQKVDGRNDEIPEGYLRSESDSSRKIKHGVFSRYIITDPKKNIPGAMIVPDYQVNQPYYNQFLTGDTFMLKLTCEQSVTNYLSDGYFMSENRHFYVSGYQVINVLTSSSAKLVGIPDSCPVKVIGNDIYKARAGYPEEAHKYEFVGKELESSADKRDNSDIIRGNFGSYVGVQNYSGHACDQVSIMIPGYKESMLYDYIKLRESDTSAFYAISDRFSVNVNDQLVLLQGSSNSQEPFRTTLFRGDCYICQYTHRIIRNFNDPSAPYNDSIVDANTWKDNYNPDKPEEYSNINLGDVNATKLGMWLTFQLRSSYNLNIRTVDKSQTDEYLMCGNYRSFFPSYSQQALGAQKIPDSDQYNKGFSKSVSEKYYFEVADVPYIKQEFQNRIVFSDIHINDAYKNGFRVLRTMNHKDYPMTHGSITKLIELQNSLLVIFEHGVGVVTINNSAEHPSQVLSDVKIINDMYGSQWKDSILKTPSGVYGVDTVAKKIWRVRDGKMEIISDFKVQEFLNQNITLSERELTTVMGVRNVKTVYNAFKHDVMFTFYDNLYGLSEKAWNLCWNELLGIFTTFYSWIPSEMQNIDNIPFSFNRDTLKAIGKLGVSKHGNAFSDGITLTNNVLNVTDSGFTVADKTLTMTYLNQQGVECEYEFNNTELSKVTNDSKFIGFLHLDNRVLLDEKVPYAIKYELQRDRQYNFKLFTIKNVNLPVKEVKTLFSGDGTVTKVPVSYLALADGVNYKELLSELYYRNIIGRSYADYDNNKELPFTRKLSTVKEAAGTSYVKIDGTELTSVEHIKSFIDKYGPDHTVGYIFTVSGKGNLITKITQTLGEIYESCIGSEDPTKYNSKPLKDYFLLQMELDYSNPHIHIGYPIFKNKQGKRLMLDSNHKINPDKIIRYLNIKATLLIDNPASDARSAYYNQFVEDGGMMDAGYFESQVAVTTDFNLSLLSTDFWKHGQAGLIDITDKVYPTYWYGHQHPFEFECVIAENPDVHKIFTNLELVANKVKPESFHYEVVGDVYDFAEDKPTMYFRQEALKALYQYNGYDIEYNPNFLEIQPIQHNRSADLPKYYSRWDTVNEIYDEYKKFAAPPGFNYDHLSGAEIVYYPTRNEFRVWNHVKAVDIDEKVYKDGMLVETSVLKANCRYLEDKWNVSINPIVVTYKNEFIKSYALADGKSMFYQDSIGVYKYSSWVKAASDSNVLLPPINITGTKLEQKIGKSNIEIPGNDVGKDNALYGLYDLTEWNQGNWSPIDPVQNSERKETDVRGKFMKVRIRYKGEDLAIIDFLNTIYQISYA